LLQFDLLARLPSPRLPNMFGFGIPIGLGGGMGMPIGLHGGMGIPMGGMPVMMGGHGIMLGGPRLRCKHCGKIAGSVEDMMDSDGHDDDCPRSRRSSRAISTSSGDRSSRLASNVTTLYHQTSPSAARSIISSQQMTRGSNVLDGVGIYFAASPVYTHAKAHEHGVFLAAKVKLGRVKDVVNQDSSASFASLSAEGYDSVRINGRSSGVEYVVYNWDQVSDIREYSRC